MITTPEKRVRLRSCRLSNPPTRTRGRSEFHVGSSSHPCREKNLPPEFFFLSTNYFYAWILTLGKKVVLFEARNQVVRVF